MRCHLVQSLAFARSVVLYSLLRPLSTTVVSFPVACQCPVAAEIQPRFVNRVDQR
jgi:hypothetical protein